MMKGLCVHAGGRLVNREAIEDVITPGRMGSHYPIPHLKVLDLAVANLKRLGYSIEGAQYALRDAKHPETGIEIKGAEFFGLLSLKNGTNHDDYGLVAGVRNSHNKSMASGLVLGSRVFVCDNMAFSGEVKFGRKHTKYINRDLPHLVHDALGRLGVLRGNLEKRIETYKGQRAGDNWARCAIMKAAENDYISWSKTGKVWSEWKTPSHEEFKPRNAWSLFNAFTEVMKDYNVQDLPKRTGGVHEMFDEACNLQLAN